MADGIWLMVEGQWFSAQKPYTSICIYAHHLAGVRALKPGYVQQLSPFSPSFCALTKCWLARNCSTETDPGGVPTVERLLRRCSCRRDAVDLWESSASVRADRSNTI